MRRIITLVLLFLSIQMTAADRLTYGSAQIKDAYEKAGLGKVLADSIQNADTTVQLNSRTLAVRIANGQVEHIGCYLFPNEMRTLMPSPAYDYLEFACLDKQLGITENPFVYKNLKIEGGTWADIMALTGKASCTVTQEENVSYQVLWTKEDGSTITATFPIGYEKLYMMTRTEIENKFINELRSTKVTQPEDILEPDTLLLKSNEKNLLVMEGEHYILKEVNRNLYYAKTEDRGVILVWDSKYPAESLANMFISHDKWLTGCPITMRIPTHQRNRTEEVTVTVRQLLAYAYKTGCKVYWGLESLTETELKGTLFLYNPSYGFDHVINVSCDPRQIGTKELKLNALAALFSPTTNVKNLFAKNKGKSSPKKIEE